MGSSLKLIERAPAGSIVGIGGLEDILLKSGTISTSLHCPNFVKMQTISLGLVKVAIQTKIINEMDKLKEGLAKLNKADPSVAYFTNAKGELILSTCGEIHLERCIKDLNDEFCPGVDLEISDPIIPFKETILSKRLSSRPVKKKDEDFEEIDTSSSEDEEEKADGLPQELTEEEKSQMTVGELIAF